MLLLWMLPGLPIVWSLVRDAKRELADQLVLPPSVVDYLKWEARGTLLFGLGVIIWPALVIRRAAVIRWLVDRPWLLFPRTAR